MTKQHVRESKRLEVENEKLKARLKQLKGGQVKINLNEFDREITLQEGKKISLPIGQVKEVRKLIFKKLASYDDATILENIRRKD